MFNNPDFIFLSVWTLSCHLLFVPVTVTVLGPGAVRNGQRREGNLFFSLIQQSATFSSSPFPSLVKATLGSLSYWCCRASLIAGEWGELLFDPVGKHPPTLHSKAPLKAAIHVTAGLWARLLPGWRVGCPCRSLVSSVAE